MLKALFILGMYVILLGIAGIEIYFKLKKDRKKVKYKDQDETRS